MQDVSAADAWNRYEYILSRQNNNILSIWNKNAWYDNIMKKIRRSHPEGQASYTDKYDYTCKITNIRKTQNDTK